MLELQAWATILAFDQMSYKTAFSQWIQTSFIFLNLLFLNLSLLSPINESLLNMRKIMKPEHLINVNIIMQMSWKQFY